MIGDFGHLEEEKVLKGHYRDGTYVVKGSFHGGNEETNTDRNSEINQEMKAILGSGRTQFCTLPLPQPH